MDRSLPPLVLLSLAAGCVDAAGFLAAGVFPANMTGNTVVLGLALVRPKVIDPMLAAIVLVAFCLGSTVGSLLLRRSGTGWSPRVGLVLLLGVISLLVTAGLGAFFAFTALGLIAFAMGLQAAAVAQLGVAGVSTVVVTGTLTAFIRRAVGADRNDARTALGAPLIWTWVGYFAGAVVGGSLAASWSAFPALVAAGLGFAAIVLFRSRAQQAELGKSRCL